MKKAKIWLLSVLAMVMSLICLVACGGNSLVGTYKLDSMTINETTYKVGDMVEDLGTELTADLYTLELKADKTFVMTAKMTVGGETVENSENGTWVEADGKVKLSVEGQEETLDLTIDGNTLIMGTAGDKYVFKK